jgi:hypothetical protein
VLPVPLVLVVLVLVLVLFGLPPVPALLLLLSVVLLADAEVEETATTVLAFDVTALVGTKTPLDQVRPHRHGIHVASSEREARRCFCQFRGINLEAKQGPIQS